VTAFDCTLLALLRTLSDAAPRPAAVSTADGGGGGGGGGDAVAGGGGVQHPHLRRGPHPATGAPHVWVEVRRPSNGPRPVHP
jgi:hypothetical protein